MAGCCKLLGARILCSCNCPFRSGHNVLENGLSCIFQALGNILLQKVQNQHD